MINIKNPENIVDFTSVDIDHVTFAQLKVFGGQQGLTAEEYATHLVSLQLKFMLNKSLKKTQKKLH